MKATEYAGLVFRRVELNNEKWTLMKNKGVHDDAIIKKGLTQQAHDVYATPH